MLGRDAHRTGPNTISGMESADSFHISRVGSEALLCKETLGGPSPFSNFSISFLIDQDGLGVLGTLIHPAEQSPHLLMRTFSRFEHRHGSSCFYGKVPVITNVSK